LFALDNKHPGVSTAKLIGNIDPQELREMPQCGIHLPPEGSKSTQKKQSVSIRFTL
jgi:hypothetical protein